MLESTLGQLALGKSLSQAEMTAAIDAIMRGECSDGEIGLLLVGLKQKGETIDEIVGAAEALRKHMTPIRTRHKVLIDTCGTGGSGAGTFNISTAAGLVTAAAGLPVAKHGNRAASSKTGSADVLAELGVKIDADVTTVEACLNDLGFAFCFARLFHPAMKHVAEVRKKLGMPTIFNMLGPLCNPARAPFQLLGVGNPDWRQPLAEALARLGTKRALVVHGDDGLGEVTLSAPTRVTEVRDGKLSELVWEPRDFGFASIAREALLVNTPAESAAMIRQVLAGKPGPARDIVVANAAAALWLAEQAPSLAEGVALAEEAIGSGDAANLLEAVVAKSNGG